MNIFENNFSKKHLHIFLTILILFTIANFAILLIAMDTWGDFKYVVLTTAATITGPLTGAIARQWQECCAEFSLKIIKFCAPILLFGTIFQFIKVPLTKASAIRLSIWILCLLIWFLGGILSFGHALE